ncbi:aminotransferase class V-fold PLP-dependent enzyme [Baekduia soli]|uniref:Aminotransferase class V-fold PLP-dependent enzyme n=1 Tax=Baekduia soli TaxID=496014 RepID=A0A5B8U7A1_9ACTN|nr:aminotransferase class V-fold PLP-dependent enzyme [Baekduia soli]QEC48821.1 aminotransferase class V-fold PLP-dependent enzyme [Baekduia soli]
MDPASLRAAFPVLEHTTYLNAGTCGPIPQAAHAAAVEAWRLGTRQGRSSAFYERVLELVPALRERYAALLGAEPDDVALTAGTSDGCGRVLGGLALGGGDEILTADDEHPGLLGPLVAARDRHGVTLRAVPLAEIADAVGPATRLVACSHVSWHSGAVAPVAALARVSAGGVPVLLDGAQGSGAVPIDVATLGATFYAGSGQKWLCGPVGCGMLWVDPAWGPRLAPQAPAYGSLQDASLGIGAVMVTTSRRYDAPSQDLATLAAAAAAYDVLAGAGWAGVHARAATLAARLADDLRGRGVDVVDRDDSTLVAWSTPGDDEAIAIRDRLAAEGIVIRHLPGTGRLRASVGAWNTEDDLARLVAAVAR